MNEPLHEPAEEAFVVERRIAAWSPALRRGSRAETRGPDRTRSRARGPRACRSQSPRTRPRVIGGPLCGVPCFATSSRHAVSSANSSTSSAVSVSRSLTFISGSDPTRSAIAIRKIAVRWKTRIASSVASTSFGAAPRRLVANSAASSSRVGGVSNKRASSSSSSSIGCSAICFASHALRATRFSRRSSAAGFSLSSARYALRRQIAR